MTSLTLQLDNVDVSEHPEQISKLFPKCRPRSDFNLNPIIPIGNDHCEEHITDIDMNVDIEDRWNADGSLKENSQFASTDGDDLLSEHTGETYKLRDSRIIEIAGGRELFSQSRSKAVRKNRVPLKNDGERRNQTSSSPMTEGVWELKGNYNDNNKSSNQHQAQHQCSNVREYPETVFSSDVCSLAMLQQQQQQPQHQNNVEHNSEQIVSEPTKSETADVQPNQEIKMTVPYSNEVVVYDDIEGCWSNEEKNIEDVDNRVVDHLGEIGNVAKIIGNLPIAVYEGSPRRYGHRQMENKCTHPHLPSAHSLLTSPSVYPPRPGFPHRVFSPKSPSGDDEMKQTSLDNNAFNHASSPQTLNTNNKSTFDYLYEFSETRKVLEEFFKCPAPEEERPLDEEFHDLDYELRRQTDDSGNSYVGQRLAKGHDQTDMSCLVPGSPRKIHATLPHPVEVVEYENNFLDLSIGTGSSGDLGETEVGLQVGHSRNFTLSPETTDCDSNCGDLDSEVSIMLMENDMEPSRGLLGSNTDLAIPSDSLRLYSSMPVLEDGLSSGHASDTDNNNPTVMLMKRQITEIEREINESICKSKQYSNKHKDVFISNNYETADPTDLTQCHFQKITNLPHLEILEKTPPPPAPAPHRVMQTEKCTEVEAAIKDIRLTLQKTKTLPIKCHPDEEHKDHSVSPVWVPRQGGSSAVSGESDNRANSGEEDNDTDLETDRLLGEQRTDEHALYDDKGWRKPKTRTIMPSSHSLTHSKQKFNAMDEGVIPLVQSEPHTISNPPSPAVASEKSISPQGRVMDSVSSTTSKKEKENKKKGRNKEGLIQPSVLIEGVLFRARYLGSTQLVCEGQPTKTTRMMQAEEAVSRIKEASNQMIENYGRQLEFFGKECADRLVEQSSSVEREPQTTDHQVLFGENPVHFVQHKSHNTWELLLRKGEQRLLDDQNFLPLGLGMNGTVFRLHFLGSVEVDEDGTRKRRKKNMVEIAVTKIKAPDGESQPSTEVDLFISTEKIMVLNTDLKEIMMDHALRTISYIADIGDLVVLMARRRFVPHEVEEAPKINRTPKMICHVFESEEAQFIAQSIGQAFQVAYMEFLKANGIEDHSFVKEMDYQEVLNSQEIFGDELQMFAKKEMQKEVVVPKAKGEILGVVIVESGWGSMLPTVVIANLAPAGAAARCGQLNIGDQIIAINGISLVGLPLSTCQTYIKNSKTQTVVKLTVVPCAPVVEVKIKRPDTKYQLGFSVQNGVICSLLRGGIAERGGVRVGHRIIEINNQSVVAVPHEKIVNLLATSVGEILMKTMPTSMFRLLTGQENPIYI